MKEKFIQDLRNLGIKEGDILHMHSSFSSLKKSLTETEVIDSLLEVLGEEGTLMLPSLSYSLVTAETPAFDVAKTGTCVGWLPEFFRTRYPGVIRSVHPTHSCAAIGKRAEELVGSHALDDSPVGPNSPLRKLCELGGKILFLGCGTEPNTSMHGVEELSAPPYLYGDDIVYTITDNERNTYTKKYRTHGFAHTEQRYDRLEELLDKSDIKHGKVLHAECTLMNAKAVWETGHHMLLENPLYFIDYTEEH